MHLHRSQEFKKMLPAVSLITAIRTEFWRPLENPGKAEWVRY